MIAARDLCYSVDMDHFDKAFQRVTSGATKKNPFVEQQQRIAAYHNAGHAIVDFYLCNREYIKGVRKMNLKPCLFVKPPLVTK